MLKSMEEIKKADLPVGGVINGVDNPNLTSVDSIEPITSDADSVSSEGEETSNAAVKEEGKEEGNTAEGKTEEEIAAEIKANAEGKTEAELEAEASAKAEAGSKTEAELKAEAEAEAVAEKKTPVEKRIGQLTKKYRTAERALGNEQAKRKEVEAELKKLKAAIPDTEKPVREDFEDDEAYVEALTDWKVETKFKVLQADTTKQTDEEKELQTITEVEEELEEISDRGREKYDNYDDIVFAKDLILTQEMVEIVLTSDIAEDILYYIGSNPDKATALSEMTVFKAAKEVGKIEVELLADIPKPNVSSEENPNNSKEVKGKPKKASKAPAPIDTVKATGVTEKDPANMNPKEYRQWRESNKE